MADTGGMDVTENHLPALLGALTGLGAEQVQAAAKAVATYAAANHPYQNQTGQAESGFYIVTKSETTYGQGFIGGGEGDGDQMLPSVDPPGDELTAYVANASGHFIFLELGTVHMPPFPSLVPALEAVSQTFWSGGDFEAKLAALLGL